MDLNLSVPAQNLFVSTSGTNLSLSVPQQISLTPDSQATQALSLSVHDQTLGVIYVAGKQGDKGDQGPPGPRGSGISSLNGLTGDVNIYGTGGNLFVITVTPNRIYISGSGLVNSGDLLALSGYLSNQIAASGSTLYSLITGVSGYATSSAALSGYVTGQLAALSGYVVQQDSTLSGRIESTGQTLYNLYTGISGGNAVALSGYVTGQIAALSGYVNQQDSTLSGQTSSTGSALYSLIIGLSGQAQSDYATKLSLYQTGSYLYVLITGVSGDLNTAISSLSGQVSGQNSALSGLVTGISGILNDAIIATGNSVVAHSNGIGVNLSGAIAQTGSSLYQIVTGLSGQALIDYAAKIQLTQTGVSLGNKIDALSGFATGVSGYLQDQINALPTTATVQSTGQQLYILLTGFSGQAQTDYATKVQLTQTGVNLGAQINSLSGFTTGISGALQTLIDQANADVNSINGQSGTLTISGTGTITVISGGQGLIFVSGRETDLSGYITTGNADARYYPLSTNPSGYVTGEYYTKDQIDNFFLYQNPLYFRDLPSADVTGRRQMTYGYPTGFVPTTGNFISVTNDQWLTGFITPSGQPGLAGFIVGNNIAEIHARITNVNPKTTSLYYKLYTYSPSGVFTLITTSSPGSALNDVDTHHAISQYITGFNLSIDDRIAIDWYARTNGSAQNPNIQLLWGDDTSAAEALPFSAALIIGNFYPNTNPSGFITTGQTGQFYPASNPAQYATSGNLASTGSNLYVLVTGMSGQAQIDYATKTQLTQSGVDLDNRISSLSGYTNNQDYLTGRAAVLYASGISGGLEARITATGNATIAHANSIGSTISGNVTQTGVTLLNFIVGGDTNLSGNLTQTGITLNNRINSLSGYGEGIYVHRTGYELISGQKQFVSSLILTGIQFLGQSGSGIYLNVSQDGTVVFAGPSGSTATIGSGISGSIFAVTDQFEAPMLDIYSDGRILLGQYLANTMMVSGSGVSIGVSYIPANYRFLISGDWQYIGNVFSGQSNIADLFYPRQGNPSGYITGLPGTGNLATLNQLNSLSGFTTGLSGALQTIINATGVSAINHANGVGANLSGNLTQTGIVLNGHINSLSGYVDNQDYATGRAAILYASGISGVVNAAIIATGNAAVAHANGIGVNLSGNLAQTGATLIARDNSISGVLQGYIDSISAGTGIILRDVVYTSGTQYISGTKYFIGNTYIDNLFVTGTQTVVNTQDVYVGNNWMVLNATGGARDSAIFVSTGFTGINATGGVIGFDVPSNTWRFGLGGYLTDLASLPSIASVTDIVNASGGLEARIVQTGAAAVAYANTIGLNLSGVLAQTGATLISLNLATSGALTGRLYQTGLDLYTQIYNTGQIILSASGGLEARITATGNSAVNHANSIGQTISGNLTQTGVTLGAQIAALSGYVTGFNGGVISYLTGLLPTGYSEYYIWHPALFPTIPRVNVTMELSGDANGMYGVSISGRSISGFWACLTDSVDTSGVFLDVIAKI